VADERAPPPTETIVKCSGCYFHDTDANNVLHCHKKSPRPDQQGLAVWPVVDANDWCGHGYDPVANSWNTPGGTEPQS
jgi:hypothetical protein